jgi:uncharacterized protein (TIGR03790 family)
MVLPLAAFSLAGFGNAGVGSSIGRVMRKIKVLTGILVSMVMLPGATKALALQPDEIALIVNSNEPKGKELAEYYAKARHIPDNRILELSLPTAEEMPFEEYEETVVPQVRDFLKSGNLEHQVKCFVTFYGVPLRIAARVPNVEDGREQANLRQQLVNGSPKVTVPVKALEKLAERLNPNYIPVVTGGDFASLRRRAELAMQDIFEQVRTIPDGRRRAEILGQFYGDMEPLMGDSATINRMAIDAALLATADGATTKPVDAHKLQAFKDEYADALKKAPALEQLRFDAKARSDLRTLVFDHFGAISYVSVLQDQADYLEPKDSGAAFDSELSLVHWTAYRRTRWADNQLYFTAKPRPGSITYMVMRLDAPKPDTVKDIIDASIKVEAEGLKGKVVIDSRGIVLGHETEAEVGLGPYDQSLRDLATMVRDHTKLELLADDKPEALPPHSAENVALYCGWYSVRSYIPECKFNPGAVGYHMASYELISLHNPGERGWVAGLLNDGVAATLGPVAEPYIQAFPEPDEFFPLLMTGKFTLAEVYWKTTKMSSWMIAAIGDPLYTPYKVNPPIKVDDLPEHLKEAFIEPSTGP